MRVLHLNTHASGGSYEHAALLSAALAHQGIESRVLCKDSQSAESARLLLDRVMRRSYVSFSTEPWHGTWRLLSPPAPEDLETIDVVHLHMVADWFDVPQWLETLPAKIGVVISVDDMWHATGGCFLYRGCDRYVNATDPCNPCPILKWPANHFLANAAHSRKLKAYRNGRARMVASSQWLAKIAGRSPIVKACGGIDVIPPGIDTAVFKPQDKLLCRNQLDVPADAFVIATGGASLTDANKNVPWLLEQLSHLPELQKLIVLVFGEGSVPVPARLNTRFIGGIRDRHHLASVYAAADVFVTASLMESYGLTSVEALACGTPVVAFRVGGIPESAPEGQGAILCEPQNADALLGSITTLQKSPQLRERLGRLGYETVHHRNSATSFANSFAQLYRNCIPLEQTDRANEPAAVA